MWTSMDDLPDVSWIGQYQVAVFVFGLGGTKSGRELHHEGSKVPPQLSALPPTKPAAE